MSSFQSLKAERQARQRPLASPSTPQRPTSASQSPHNTPSKATPSLEQFPKPPISSPNIPLDSISLLTPSTSTSLNVAASLARQVQHPDSGEVDIVDSVTENELYAKELGGLRVRSSSTRGRGIYAGSQAYKAGSILINALPLVSTLSTHELNKYCSKCFLSPHEISLSTSAPPQKLKRCAGCKALHYCSTKCQTADWPTHAPECKAIQRFKTLHDKAFPDRKESGQKWILNETLRAMGRICWSRARERGLSNGVDPEWWKSLSGMETGYERLSPKDQQNIGQLTQQLIHYLGAADSKSTGETLEPVDYRGYGFSSAKEFLNLFSAFKVNGFTLASPNLTPLGLAISPLLALCNHSCEPNAIVVFPEGAGKGIHLIAIRDIVPGEEIFTSYVDVSMPAEGRRKDISKRYGFDCGCSLCQRLLGEENRWVDPRWCFRHPGCESGGNLMNLPRLSDHPSTLSTCDDCGMEFDIELLMGWIEDAKRILESEERGTLRSDPAKALRTISKLLSLLFPYLPPSSYPLLPLYRLQATLHPTPTTHSSILQIAQLYHLSLEGSLPVFPKHHSNIAIIRAEKAKVLAISLPHEGGGLDEVDDGLDGKAVHGKGVAGKEVKGRLAMAVIALQEALEGCLIAFGRGNGGGVVGREMRFLLEGCQADLEGMRDGR